MVILARGGMRRGTRTTEERLEHAGDMGGKADGPSTVFREGTRLSSSKGGRNG